MSNSETREIHLNWGSLWLAVDWRELVHAGKYEAGIAAGPRSRDRVRGALSFTLRVVIEVEIGRRLQSGARLQ